MENGKILFQEFLKNKNIYNLNVGYWRAKLQKALNEKISREDQFIKNKDDKGKSFYDGNPMFSYYSHKKNRALRVIQEDPTFISENESDIKLIEAWISNIIIDDNDKEEVEIPELVISIFLTSLTVDKCVQLAIEWMSGDLTRLNIDARLEIK
jgi:hypothetical protein